MKGREFSMAEAQLLEEILINRRDVRGNRFLNDPISEKELDKILFAGLNAPSVGFSQPWEFVVVTKPETKQQIRACFEAENLKATQLFSDEKSHMYQRLKLEGIKESPVNLAVLYKPSAKPVLGQTSMEEVGRYSVVCAIQNMWLMARALNIGLGWVSILEPEKVKACLNAPADRELVAYLCLGKVSEFLPSPELEQLRWEKRKQQQEVVFFERHTLG